MQMEKYIFIFDEINNIIFAYAGAQKKKFLSNIMRFFL